MRRASLVGACLALLLLFSSCTGSRKFPNSAPSTPVSSRSESRGESAPWTALVYANNRDVWVLDRATGKARDLTPDGDSLGQDSPRFIDDETIVYNQEGNLFTVAWRTPSLPRSLPGKYGASWDIHRDLVATQIIVQTGPPRYRETDYLEVRELRSGRALWRTELQSSVQIPGDETTGREQSYEDERRVEWAPDGRNILVSDTLFYPNPKQTLFVLSREGRLITSFEGTTYARWLDNDLLIFRGFEADKWQLADLGNRTTSSLGTGLGRGNPSVEPSTKRVAFDTRREGDPRQGCTCSIVILDTPGRSGQTLRTSGVFPVWLSENELVTTEVRACRDGECGVGSPMWVTLNRSIILKVDEEGRAESKVTLPFKTFDDSTGFAEPTVMVLRS